MATERIQVYADRETKRRIELAAAKHNVPVTSYCLDAISQRLAEDEVLEDEHIEISVTPRPQTVSRGTIHRMRTLRERIAARRGGQFIAADILEQIRDERDEELSERISGLH